METPLHILHVLDNLGKGGLENGLVNLITRLPADRFRHTVCAIRRLGANVDRLPRDCVKVICLEKEDKRSFIQVTTFMKVIRQVRPDIVHSRNWPAIESVFAARLLRSCAVVHSEHGLDWSHRNGESLRRVGLRRLAFELADQVLCVSNELKDRHASRTAFDASRIAVIHNGVDTHLYSSQEAMRAKVRAENNISPTDFCIGCVGNLTPVKDHITLFRALDAFDNSLLSNASQNWRLLIVGDGPERARLEEFVRYRSWFNRVSFLGLHNNVPELLNAFDLYVLPSLSEGICNSLLEAMATGLPVLASAAGGNPEVVVNGVSGSLFPTGDASSLAEQLLFLCSREDVRRQLGREALKRVEQEFSLASMVRQYEQIYSAVGMKIGHTKRMIGMTDEASSAQPEELR
jgi:sugar transferase (PEP-CTERM/EpsH1 system associated)